MKPRALVAVTLLSFLPGCDCTYETRYVKASGTITESGVDLVRAEVTVDANKGSLTWKDFFYNITASSLQGHVLAIRLVRSDQPGISILDIPVGEASSASISSGAMIQRPGEATPNLGGLYEIVAAGLAAVELDTDLASKSRISIPLVVTEKRDWYRPSNCY